MPLLSKVKLVRSSSQWHWIPIFDPSTFYPWNVLNEFQTIFCCFSPPTVHCVDPYLVLLFQIPKLMEYFGLCWNCTNISWCLASSVLLLLSSESHNVKYWTWRLLCNVMSLELVLVKLIGYSLADKNHCNAGRNHSLIVSWHHCIFIHWQILFRILIPNLHSKSLGLRFNGQTKQSIYWFISIWRYNDCIYCIVHNCNLCLHLLLIECFT